MESINETKLNQKELEEMSILIGVYFGQKLLSNIEPCSLEVTSKGDLPVIGWHYSKMLLISTNPWQFDNGKHRVSITDTLPNSLVIGNEYILHYEFDELTITPQLECPNAKTELRFDPAREFYGSVKDELSKEINGN